MNVENLAGSPWSIVVFVIVAVVATRVLDAGLKDKLPKWLLPYISMVVGIGGQMVVGLTGGMGWKQALLYGVTAGAGGAWVYSAGAKKLPGVKAHRRRDEGSARAALLFFMAALTLALMLVSTNGCSWTVPDWTVPDWCAKGQAALKDEVSPRVEPPLKAHCVEKATKCATKGIAEAECEPVQRCKAWVAKYALITKALHRQLAALNELWTDLVKAKVVNQ